ncbi:MAG TPA: CpsD/CapB family tyrosine-protein kinase [Vicinamibacterales bacterium]|nr:CpsD/CapB family tyrosine-protein kinase [Vicinamibacterales bacterium]
MSRIEEALRRASTARAGAEAALVPDVVPGPLDGTPLTRYPREARREEGGSRQKTSDVTPPPRAVPREPAALRPGPLVEGLDAKLILSHATPVAVEQYRRLAGTLHGLQAEHGTKTVMVTSALPREGKTLTVTNLALTLSESYGRRVLLIDADLRRPAVHEMLRVPNGRGLSDGLRAQSGALPVVQVSPNLSVLPAGRADSNPMAGLTSDRMRGLLEESASLFDWVLVDTPPVGIMPDAHLLARQSHGVIFVIAANSTPFALVQRAVTEIGREHIIGTVLNRIDAGSNPATAYYGHYYDTD